MGAVWARDLYTMRWTWTTLVVLRLQTQRGTSTDRLHLHRLVRQDKLVRLVRLVLSLLAWMLWWDVMLQIWRLEFFTSKDMF
eukprot:g5077.t1